MLSKTETHHFSETKTEIEKGKFRPQTIKTKTETEKFYKNLVSFSIFAAQCVWSSVSFRTAPNFTKSFLHKKKPWNK